MPFLSPSQTPSGIWTHKPLHVHESLTTLYQPRDNGIVQTLKALCLQPWVPGFESRPRRPSLL